MADFMVYWKNYQRDVPNAGLDFSFDWHTSHETTFDKVEAGDDIWVIVHNGDAGWKLLERIRVQMKEMNPDRDSFEVREYGPFHVAGDTAQSRRFDIERQGDFEPILAQLEFSTGIGLNASGRQIGHKFQSPRALSERDAKILREYEAGS
jgi:hypothetical protein